MDGYLEVASYLSMPLTLNFYFLGFSLSFKNTAFEIPLNLTLFGT